ncbi:MAG TPA: DNA repair protein RadC [Defluviitoga sp.]|nr:DNA repair protein RadC [Defluviitoga sp.]HOP25038.1 DNA repair protein RadC [Defluviitoga sp.]HPZ29190.1 DNA repair protein RadC [Defluviitoga sp.]HQD63097.1 DNA repair protein RadC [Defluviitoga sp.]
MDDELLPREKLEKFGPSSLSDAELIALILRHGVKGISVFEATQNLLNEYKTLPSLEQASLKELSSKKGVGRVGAINLKAALEIGKRFHLQKLREKLDKITSPMEVYQICQDMVHLKSETVRAIFLDSKLNIIAIKDISNGTANMSMVHPRDIFREAILHNSISFIIVHNHPSGDSTPSMNDVDITKTITESAKIIGIPMNDHIIIGKNEYYSFSAGRRIEINE